MLAGDEYPVTGQAESAQPSSTQPESGDRVIGSVAVLSDVAPQYAPPGKTLISVSTTQAARHDVSGPALQGVRNQLVRWFGDSAQSWQHLRSYAIPYGLPVQSLRNITPPLAHGRIVLCGDYCETPSIQGAINSGLRAAEIVRGLGRL